MQVPARVRQGYFAGLGRVFEVIVTSARPDEIPPVRLEFTNNLARVLPQSSPPTEGGQSIQSNVVTSIAPASGRFLQSSPFKHRHRTDRARRAAADPQRE